MEPQILEAERQLEERRAGLQAPEVVSDPLALRQRYEELQAAEADVERLYARWVVLEGKLQPSVKVP
jgi:ATP-binding cassette subfamily F protein uup